MKYDVKDLSLADSGKLRIEWAERNMPVLRLIRERFEAEKPLAGIVLSACLHVTTETACLVRTLAAGGAEVYTCASNPLSTQDDVAAALVSEGYRCSPSKARIRTRITSTSTRVWILSLTSPWTTVLTSWGQSTANGRILCKVSSEARKKTTTGVIRLKSMAAKGVLLFPVIAVNDSDTKHLFDNRYGTGQSTMDGILRATNRLMAGSWFVVGGYGWCGRGLAMRAAGMGAKVIVTEVNPLRALEAAMDGYYVMPMEKAALWEISSARSPAT